MNNFNDKSQSNQASNQDSGVITMNIKNVPLIIGLLLGAGGGGSLGTYFSSDTKNYDKIEVKLVAIEKTLSAMQMTMNTDRFTVARIDEKLTTHSMADEKKDAKFEERLRRIEDAYIRQHGKNNR